MTQLSFFCFSLCEVSMSLAITWASRAAKIFRMAYSVDSYEFLGTPWDSRLFSLVYCSSLSRDSFK